MFRRLFGFKPNETPAPDPTPAGVAATRLSAEELEKIGTGDDPLHDYEAGLERNFTAMEAERLGDVDAAIELYETNVSGGFVDGHPYERLATIYEARNSPDEAVRVLTAYVKLAESGALPRGAQRSAERRMPGVEARLRRLRAKTPR